MNYSKNESDVRVDIFKPSGKYYDTICITMNDYSSSNVVQSVRNAMPNNYKGMIAVCLEPYHQYSYPVMFTIGDRNDR